MSTPAKSVPAKSDFGAALLKQRLIANLTQQQAADGIGVALSTYHGWESNKSMYRIDMLPKLAQVFGIELTALLPDGLRVTISQPNGNGAEITFDARQLYEDLIGTLREDNRVLMTSLTLALAENERLRSNDPIPPTTPAL